MYAYISFISQLKRSKQISTYHEDLCNELGLCNNISANSLFSYFRLTDKFPRRLKRFIVSLLFLALVCSTWITCMRNGYLPRSTGRLSRTLFAIFDTMHQNVSNGSVYFAICPCNLSVYEIYLFDNKGQND